MTKLTCSKMTQILCISLAAGFAQPAWANFTTGYNAYRLHDYPTALREFKADGGAQSAYLLAIMYYKGEGTAPNKKETVKWLRQAAEKGNARAANNLGMMYDKGDGVPQDLPEAAKWYRKAAEKGHAASQYNLGLMYANGEGVEKDPKEAVKWLRKAAAQGHPKAQQALNAIGEIDGVSKNRVEPFMNQTGRTVR